MAIVSELHFGPLNSHEDHTTALNEAEQKINEIIFVVNEEQEQVPTWDSIEGKPEFFPADPSSQEVQWINVQGAPEIPSALDAYTRAQSDAKYGKLAGDNNWSETNIFEDVVSFLGTAVPFVVASNGLVENFNAQFLGGELGAHYLDLAEHTGELDGSHIVGSIGIPDSLTEVVAGDGTFSTLNVGTVEPQNNLFSPSNGGPMSFSNLNPANPPFSNIPPGALVVNNLDVERLDGQLGSFYLNWTNFINTPTDLAGYGITDAASDTELTTHEADTTSIHGIADTAVLAVKNADNQFSANQTIERNGANPMFNMTRTGGATFQVQVQSGVVNFWTATNHDLKLGRNLVVYWYINSSGHWVPNSTAAVDFGTTTLRIRDAWLSRDVNIGRNIVLDAPTTATGATAGADTLPANPVGFLVVSIAGTSRKIPYYAT